jgi:hypothetical protein
MATVTSRLGLSGDVVLEHLKRAQEARNALEDLNRAIERANAAAEREMRAIEARRERYAAALEACQEFADETADDIEAFVDEKSERWQEGEAAERVRDWASAWRDYSPEGCEEIEAPEPIEAIGEDDCDAFEALELAAEGGTAAAPRAPRASKRKGAQAPAPPSARSPEPLTPGEQAEALQRAMPECASVTLEGDAAVLIRTAERIAVLPLPPPEQGQQAEIEKVALATVHQIRRAASLRVHAILPGGAPSKALEGVCIRCNGTGMRTLGRSHFFQRMVPCQACTPAATTEVNS